MCQRPPRVAWKTGGGEVGHSDAYAYSASEAIAGPVVASSPVIAKPLSGSRWKNVREPARPGAHRVVVHRVAAAADRDVRLGRRRRWVRSARR